MPSLPLTLSSLTPLPTAAMVYEQLIAQYLNTDPLDFAQLTDAPQLHMILTKKDLAVPTSSQMRLWQSFGQPNQSWLHGGHVTTLLGTAWFNSVVTRRALNSLTEKLVQPAKNYCTIWAW